MSASGGQTASATRSFGRILTTFSTPADPQKDMDLDRTYTKEESEQLHTTGLKMEYPRDKDQGAVDQGTPGEDQWRTRCPRQDTVGRHLLRWHRTESAWEWLSEAYALHKTEKASVK